MTSFPPRCFAVIDDVFKMFHFRLEMEFWSGIDTKFIDACNATITLLNYPSVHLAKYMFNVSVRK